MRSTSKSSRANDRDVCPLPNDLRPKRPSGLVQLKSKPGNVAEKSECAVVVVKFSFARPFTALSQQS